MNTNHRLMALLLNVCSLICVAVLSNRKHETASSNLMDHDRSRLDADCALVYPQLLRFFGPLCGNLQQAADLCPDAGLGDSLLDFVGGDGAAGFSHYPSFSAGA